MACRRTASQGSRSASVSTIPCAIFFTFAGEWNWSASANSQPNRAASNRPTVVLPEPVTPIRTMTKSALPTAFSLSMKRWYKDGSMRSYKVHYFFQHDLPSMFGPIEVYEVGCVLEHSDFHFRGMNEMIFQQFAVFGPRPEIAFRSQY